MPLWEKGTFAMAKSDLVMQMPKVASLKVASANTRGRMALGNLKLIFQS